MSGCVGLCMCVRQCVCMCVYTSRHGPGNEVAQYTTTLDYFVSILQETLYRVGLKSVLVHSLYTHVPTFS